MVSAQGAAIRLSKRSLGDAGATDDDCRQGVVDTCRVHVTYSAMIRSSHQHGRGHRPSNVPRLIYNRAQSNDRIESYSLMPNAYKLFFAFLQIDR